MSFVMSLRAKRNPFQRRPAAFRNCFLRLFDAVLYFGWVWLEDGSFVQLSPRFEIYFFIVGVHDLTSGGSQGGGQLTEMISHNWLTSKIRSRRAVPSRVNTGQGKKTRLAVLVGAVGTKVLFKRFLRKAVEGERCHGALETRSSDAPGAVSSPRP